MARSAAAQAAVIAMMLLALACLATAPAARAASVEAQETPQLLWPYFNFPPMFIPRPDGTLDGYGPGLMLLLQDALPEFNHTLIEANPERIFQSARQGERIVLIGTLATPQREQFLTFSSVPCRLAFPMRAIIRRSDLPRLAPQGNVSLLSLLADPSLHGGYAQWIYHGKAQEFLDSQKGHPGLQPVGGNNPLGQLMEMLRLERIDWFLFDPATASTLAEELDLGDSVVALPCDELPSDMIDAYVAAPNTVWGRATVARMDAALAEAALDGRLHDILAPWIPPGLLPEFDKAYETHILTPAKALDAKTGTTKSAEN